MPIKSSSQWQLRKDPPAKRPLIDPGAAVERLGKKPEEAVLPAGSRMPMRPGEIILTEQEQLDLDRLGYQKGDAIPSDLAERLTGLREAEAAKMTGAIDDLSVTGKRVDVVPGQQLDISQLPPEKQLELRQHMQRAEVQMQQIEEAQASEGDLAGLPHSVRQAAAMAGEPVTLYRGSGAKPAAPPAPPAPPAKPQPPRTSAPAAPRPPASPPPPPPPLPAAPQAEAEAPLSTGVMEITHCPNCRWPLAEPVTVKPGEQDLFNLGVAMLGGRPFMKEMTFLEGQMSVVFRVPPTSLSEMAFRQIGNDVRSGLAVNYDDYWRIMWEYRLVISLYSARFGNEVLHVAEQVDKVTADDVGSRLGETPLPGIVQQLRGAPFLNIESTWRLLDRSLRRFNNLVDVLEVQSEDRSFSNAVES